MNPKRKVQQGLNLKDLPKGDRINFRQKAVAEINRVNSTFSEDKLLPHLCGPINIVFQIFNVKRFSLLRPSDDKYDNYCHERKLMWSNRQESSENVRHLICNRVNSNRTHFKKKIRFSFFIILIGVQISDSSSYEL